MSVTDDTPRPSVLSRPRVLTGDETSVLLVDDEYSVRLVAKLMLERAGYRVVEADTAAAAVARAEEAPFAVVVLDFTLPDRSGTAILPELRVLAPRARIVLTSGRSEDELPGHGADVYLAKPFSRDQLLAAVRGAFAA